MKGIAVNDHCLDAFTLKDVLKVVVTVVVPAPEEPVIAMTGCLADMSRLRASVLCEITYTVQSCTSWPTAFKDGEFVQVIHRMSNLRQQQCCR